MFLFFVFQKKAWHTIKTMVNLPVISPFKKRYSWVQLAGHTGEMKLLSVFVSGVGMAAARKTVFLYCIPSGKSKRAIARESVN